MNLIHTIDEQFITARNFSKETTILIANLHPDVTVRLLSLYFKKYGLVNHCEIFKDENSSMIKIYALIDFESVQEKEYALEEMHLQPIKGWEVIVTDIRAKSHFIQYGRVKVHEIPSHVSALDLQKAFEFCGTVKYAMIERKINGDSKGSGYVEFTLPLSANVAVKCLQQIKLWDVRLKVELDNDLPYFDQFDENSVVVKGFPLEWDDELLESFILNELVCNKPLPNYYVYKVNGVPDESPYIVVIICDNEKHLQLLKLVKCTQLFDHGYLLVFRGPLKLFTSANEVNVNNKLQLSKKLILHGLNDDVLVTDVVAAFKKYGPVADVNVSYQDNITQGLFDIKVACIEFMSEEAAKRALEGYISDIDINVLIKKSAREEYLQYQNE